MRSMTRLPIACALLLVPFGARAESDRWSFAFGQGVAEYAVGSFETGASHLALSCAEAGIAPGTVSVNLARAGFAPTAPTTATFMTDAGRARLRLDADGSARSPTLAAPAFARLWRLIATAKSLRVAYGPGEPMTLPAAGAAELLGKTVCPKQLAQ